MLETESCGAPGDHGVRIMVLYGPLLFPVPPAREDIQGVLHLPGSAEYNRAWRTDDNSMVNNYYHPYTPPSREENEVKKH